MSTTNKRSFLSYNPIYGNLQGWTIADLDPAIAQSVNVFKNINVDTTSTAISYGGNGIQILCQFSDSTTSCSIDLIDSTTSTTLYTWTGINNLNKGGLYFSYYKNQTLLEGDSIKIRVYNFSGTGTVYLDYAYSN